MRSEPANFILDRVTLRVAPIRQPPRRKGNEAHEPNWSFNFESGRFLLGARARSCDKMHVINIPALCNGGTSLVGATHRCLPLVPGSCFVKAS
jgi:hypothetical protein